MKIVRFAWLLLIPSMAMADDFRTWNTVASAREMVASFRIEKDGRVGLESPGGRKYRIPLDHLSRIDQAYVQLRQTAGERDIPPALEALFGTSLVDCEGQPVSPATLAGKTLGIYFSAAWCPPCRTFTPQLVSAYTELLAEDRPFEIVFASSDRSEDAAEAYRRDYGMTWPALPFGSDKIEALKEKYGVRGIPMLVVIDSAGKTLSTQARFEVMQSGARAFDNW